MTIDFKIIDEDFPVSTFSYVIILSLKIYTAGDHVQVGNGGGSKISLKLPAFVSSQIIGGGRGMGGIASDDYAHDTRITHAT